MRKLLMIMAVASMSIFASCDKCKDDPCKNGADCDKKSGDCTCATYYNGDSCEGEVRNSWDGTYSGNSTIELAGTQVLPTTVIVTNTGSDVTEQTMDLSIITGFDGSGNPIVSEFTIVANMTSNNTLELTRTKIPFTLIPGESEAYISGPGEYTAGNMLTAEISIQGVQSGFTATASFSGTK